MFETIRSREPPWSIAGIEAWCFGNGGDFIRFEAEGIMNWRAPRERATTDPGGSKPTLEWEVSCEALMLQPPGLEALSLSHCGGCGSCFAFTAFCAMAAAEAMSAAACVAPAVVSGKSNGKDAHPWSEAIHCHSRVPTARAPAFIMSHHSGKAQWAGTTSDHALPPPKARCFTATAAYSLLVTLLSLPLLLLPLPLPLLMPVAAS